MKRKHFILALVAMLWSFSFSAYADDVIKVSNWAELKAALEANDGVQRSAARQRSTAMRTSGTASITEADFTGGMSVQLTGDCVGEGYVEIKKSGTTILDLNGYTIKGLEDGAHAYPIVNYGKLLIKDTNEEKEGTIYCGIMNGMDATGIANTSATFMMTGGHIICTHTGDDQAAIVNYGNAVIAGGIVEANGNALLNKEGAPLLDVRTGALITGEVKDDAGTLNVGDNVYTVAKIGDTRYGSLEAAIDAAVNGDVIVLVKDVTGDVTITQKADVDVTIYGDGKTFTGVMTIDGANRHTGAETLTIKNVVFQAVEGKDGCIAGAKNNAYAHNVTIEGCTFKGNDTYSSSNTFAVRFPSGAQAYGLTIKDCTVDEKMFGLLWVSYVGKGATLAEGLLVDNCTAVDVQEGITLTTTSDAKIINSTIDATGVVIRAGQGGQAVDGKANNITLENNHLTSDGDVIVLRGDATDANLSMEKNAVSGTTHISGNTADTKIAADANYWEGLDNPKVNGAEVTVNTYYSDEARTDLVRKYLSGDIIGYTGTDRIYGEVWANANSSLVVKVLAANGDVMGTATLKNTSLLDGDVQVSWYIRLNGESSNSWEVAWSTVPTVGNMPAKVQLWIDDAETAVAEGAVVLNAPDDLNKVNVATTDADGRILGFHTTIDAALKAVKEGEIITLLHDYKEDVVVTQAPNVKITIDGNNKTFAGTITVDGKSQRYETAALTIKNVNFDATAGISADACINLGAEGNNNTRYTNGVTVDNCTFTDNDYSAVAVKSYTGGDWNLQIIGCEANGMHSLAQLKNVEQGLVISGNTANTKNGINLNQTYTATITDNEINVKGYAVRIGEKTGGNITLTENTLKTDNSEGDPVIELRGTVEALNMTKNVVSGDTHIKGTATTVAVDANYWDGYEQPVVSGAEIKVNSYYPDEALSTLVRNEMGSINAFVSADRITGDVTSNAKESLVVKVLGADNAVIGTSTLEKTEYINGFNKELTWRINLGADDSDSWAMVWNEGAPSVNNLPAKVVLVVDGEEIATADVKFTANGDGASPVFAAKTDADGKILSFIACDGEYNLNNAANKLVAAAVAGDNLAILTAGTYKVPTGKDLTITGIVDDVKFDMASHVGIYSSMTFNNVTFEYSSNNDYVGLQHAGTMVYNNCTINGQVFLYGESETFNECTFNQTNSAKYNVWTYSAKDVDFNECIFNSAGKSVLIYHESASVTNDVNVVKSTFNASQAVDGKAAIEMDSSLSGAINLTIDGATTADGFDEGYVSGNSLWNNKKGNKNDANNDITVVVNNETVLQPIYTAKIGDKSYRTLQEAIDAVKNGEEIVLVDDCAETVEINKTSVAFTIDGAISETENAKFNGKIKINIGQNVTVKNVDFVWTDNANHDFIANVGSPTGGNYNTTMLVEGCTFTGNRSVDVVAVRTIHPTDVIVKNCTATGLHSLIQNTGGQKVTVDNVTMTDSKSGISLGGVRASTVKNSNITAEGYGVRIDAATANAVHSVEASEIEAFIPVVVRKASTNVNLTFNGTNNFNQTNTDGYWCVIGTSEYEENGALPTAATGKVSVTLAGEGLDPAGIYGSFGVASINREDKVVNYLSLAEALDAALDGETVNLHWTAGDAPISMEGTVCGKTVTITGTADVDWSKGWFYVGRNGTADGKVIFANANLNSVSNTSAYGINVSGRKNGSADTFNGTVEFKNSTVVLDYLIQKNVMTLDNSTLTVKNGCSLTGRLANETESGELATSTTTLNNGSKLVVIGQNGMNLGYEGYGVLNIDETSTFEATQNYGVAANGTMNIAGKASVAGTLTNEGAINLTAQGATLAATAGLTVNTDVADYKVAYIEGVYKLVEKDYIAQVGDQKFEVFEKALDAVENGGTITLLGGAFDESGKEIDFTKDITFEITGAAPEAKLPIVTFQNATVNIKDANFQIPELDARQNATINVDNSTVYSAGGNPIVKSYYNGTINIKNNSKVYTHQATTMGYINVDGTSLLNVTWQTNVFGNGMITLAPGATFNTAALQLTGKDYSNRDNTDVDRVGKPATVVVDGATLTAGKVYSASGADYSYETENYGINVGTIEGKNALLDIKNGGTVNFYMADGYTVNFGADATVNVNASTLNVLCRKAEGTVTLANAGTINVSGASNLAAAKVTGDGWFYMNGVSLDADTKLLGAKVRFASGENTVDGSTIDNGLFQVGIGAYNGVDANVDTENGVVVNVKNNAKIGSKDGAYAGWVGTGFYDTDDQKAAAMTTAKYVLNIENSIAEFGYLHVSNDGELNVNGVPANKAHYNNSDYAFRAGDFIINGTANFTGTDVLAFYTKVSCDNGTDKPGTLNINAGTEYEAERHNGAVATDSNFTLYKSGVVNVAEGADLQACEASSIAADAALNIAGSVTALGTVANNGAINFTSDVATLTTATTGLTIGYNVDPDKKVVYADGAYKVVAKDYVAYIGEQGYESLAEALTAAANGETVSLSWNEGDPAIAMEGTVCGKTVTITGTANVDWSKGWFYVGRGGEGNATVTFDNANLTSASSNSNSGLGIHVSGREKDTNNKYDGTLVIKNSTIALDYLINRGAITVDGATLTVKSGFGIAGRPASETESGADATATITLENNAKLVVNNHNGMGLGQAAEQLEGYGVMNVNSGSTFETTQAFNVSAKGQMNVNGGTVKITGNLTNNGTVYVAGASTLDAAVAGDGWFYMNGVTLGADTKLNGAKVAFINGENTVKGSTIKDGWFSVGIGQNAAAATAAAFAQANGITLGDVTVNVSENATIYTSTDAAYSGWVGSAYSADKDAHKYILNITNSLARFGYMHVSKDGVLNATGHSTNKYENVDFYVGNFINNGNVTLNGVDAWAMYSKISVDHADAVLNIENGTTYMSNCTTGNVNANTFLYYKAGTVNVDETSSVNIEKATTFVDGAVLNIAGNVTAKGAITGNGAINFTAMGATLAAQEGLTINHPFGGGYQVERIDGVYRISHYVASVNGVNYESLEAALKALTDGATLTFLEDITVTEAWDYRSNGALVTAANVTINGDGKTLTLTGAVNDANWNTVFRFEGDNATVKNLTIDASAATDIQRGISSMLSIKVDNCKFIGNGTTAKRAIIFGEGAGASISNVVATVTNSTFENWTLGVSDNANGQDAKKVTINDNRFTNASVNVSASESVTFNHNVVADGDVIIISYTNAENVYVEATGSNVLDIDRENVIHTNPANMYVQREFTTPVASIGTSYYLTLQEAVNAGGEVVVLTNVNLSEAVVVENKTVVLNLNNNTIVPAAGATMTGGPIRLLDNADLTINGEGEISNNGNENVYAAVSVLGNNVNLTVNGGKLIGHYYGIAGNGYKTGTHVAINGGEIASGASDGLGIYHPQNGILKVIDGEITGATGIYFKGGKLDIQGGTIKGTGVSVNYEYNGSGCVATGDALVIENAAANGYAAISGISITGGTFISEDEDAAPIASYAPEAADALGEFLGAESVAAKFNNDNIDESLLAVRYQLNDEDGDGFFGVKYTNHREHLTIVDGAYTEFVNEAELSVGTLTYERNFTGFNGWQSLFVPFEIPVEELTERGYEVAYFFDVHYSETEDGMITENIKSVHFVKITQGRLRANYPYVIKRTSEANPQLSVTLYDAKLYSTAESELKKVESGSTTTRFIFAGTYKKANRVALTGDNDTPCYRFNPLGQVEKMGATANLVPFRVCMYIKAKEDSPVILDTTNAPEYIQMRVIGEENEDGTTTIYDVEADEQTVDYIYDLQGRRVLEPQKGGLYIVNGKKVLF